MALSWPAKAPGDTYLYSWVPALADGDSLASYTVTVSGAAIASQVRDGDSVKLYVYGGTAGTTATFLFTGQSANGESLTETVFLPIRTSGSALANTAQDACAFALAKIYGIGEDAPAEAADKALEILNDMLAEWRMDGMDVGVHAPLRMTDLLLIRDEFLAPIKYNLTVRVAEEYGRDVTATVASAAERGKLLISNRLLAFSPLSFEGPNLPLRRMTGINDV